ncbi:UNVERIFIED_CONTAM: hypothetical protein HDU68_003553 [Siphonaria sp. JEL0065]|nr:hypothetical protein HDU68_003553 [Siphonaria sp. JEL0065]
MPCTTSQLALGALSLAFFPAAYVLVYFMMEHKEWCFADFCVESMGSRRVPVRNTLAIYYSFLAFTAIIAFAAKKLCTLKRIVGMKLHSRYSVTLGEVAWFSTALLLTLIVVPAMIWKPYWNMWASMLVSMANGKMNMGPGMQEKTWPWVRIVYETMILTTGDSLALLIGLVLIPVSKNSFLAWFLDLPYTSTLRIHMWLGYSIFWLTVYHLIITILSFSLDQTPLYELFFTIPAGTPWGNIKYIYITGMVSFFLIGIVTITSLSYVRRKAYNVFYLTHFLIFISLLFAYFHASMDIFYAIPGLCMYALDGCIRLASKFSKSVVKSVVFEECGYITVTVSTTQAADARPGQFMRVNVPAVSAFEFHPWSIVKATPDSVSFMFQRSSETKEWSSLVADKLKSDSNIAIHLQGPFGKEIDLVASSQKQQNALVFYVAGTGIAASIAAIEQAVKRNTESAIQTKVFLFWTAGYSGIEKISWIQEWVANGKVVVVELDALERADAYSKGEKGVKLNVELESYDL